MRYYTLILLFALACFGTSLACTGGSSAGTLSPSGTFSTTSVSSGQYFVINALCGYTYTFSFCNGGGTATFDTQITINQTDNTTQITYNDDNCGLQSEVVWTATSNQTIHVLITEYNCNNSGGVSGTLAYQASAPSVTYNVGCTSASPTNGVGCSNSFAFSSPPADGAVIDPITGYISNATAGNAYSVLFTHSGGSQTIPITMGTPPCYTLNGDASYISVSGTDCIELTAAANDETGCAWSESLIDFNSDFTLSLDYYFGNNAGGADGTTFTFQPNPGACGAAGAQLGAGGIPNALIVEFDTYDNDGANNDDLVCDHISVEIDGDLPDDPVNFPANTAPYCGPVCAINGGASIENGGTHAIEISWNATTQQLDIFFDGNNRLSCTGDFVNSVFAGDNLVYWGATAATGGLNNQQYFCPESVILLPSEITAFSSGCQNNEAYIRWTAASEMNLDYYTLEYTTDGYLFTPYELVPATGTTGLMSTYTIPLENRYTDAYFRLKSTDYDGAIKTSGLMKPSLCAGHADPMSHYYFEGSTLLLQSLDGTDFGYSLYDMNGKCLATGRSEDGQVAHDSGFSYGLYTVHIRFDNGKLFTAKLPYYFDR